MKLKKIPSDERPREKLIKKGAKTLTNSELLAIILRTGNKKEDVLEVSNKFFKNYNIKSLSRLKFSTLKKQLGIGDAKACQIIACFELSRRLSSYTKEKTPLVKNAKDIMNLFCSEMSSLEQEHFKGIYLDSRNRIIYQKNLFIGSLNESIIHPREIFKMALEENAASIILIHNHPSGDPNPSSFDKDMTKELILSGELLGIPILDHIIIGENKYFSFKEKGLI